MKRATTAMFVLFVVGVVLIPGVEGATILIRSDGTGDQPTIQAGINAASAGDTILLAAGTYIGTDNKNLSFGGVDLVLRSQSGPGVTSIDCQGSGRAFLFNNGETAASVVEGLTIENGSAADWGGGVWCENSSPKITDCVFSDNSAVYGGGAVACGGSSVSITDCIFSGNSSDYGGALYFAVSGSPMVTDCSFSENSSTSDGGGIYCDNNSLIITGCTISNNSAGSEGGGMYCRSGGVYYATITECVFSENSAVSDGGGIYIDSTPTVMSGCTLSENTAAGIGGGAYVSASCAPLIEKSIIAFSTQGSGVYCESGGSPTFTCCDVYGNAGGDALCGADGGGNFSLDPGFCGILGSGNYELKTISPCAPGNHPNGDSCGLIGALPIGCGAVPVEETTWGRIKAQYR